jgi:hypothetical protein
VIIRFSFDVVEEVLLALGAFDGLERHQAGPVPADELTTLEAGGVELASAIDNQLLVAPEQDDAAVIGYTLECGGLTALTPVTVGTVHDEIALAIEVDHVAFAEFAYLDFFNALDDVLAAAAQDQRARSDPGRDDADQTRRMPRRVVELFNDGFQLLVRFLCFGDSSSRLGELLDEKIVQRVGGLR